jgi:hypothetical protein
MIQLDLSVVGQDRNKNATDYTDRAGEYVRQYRNE